MHHDDVRKKTIPTNLLGERKWTQADLARTTGIRPVIMSFVKKCL